MNTMSWSSAWSSTAAPDSTSSPSDSPTEDASDTSALKRAFKKSESFSESFSELFFGGEKGFPTANTHVPSTDATLSKTLPPSPDPGSTFVPQSTGTPARAIASAAIATVGLFVNRLLIAAAAAARLSVCCRGPSGAPFTIQHPSFAGSPSPPPPGLFRSIVNGG
jgi:hypothetical protein